MEHLKGLNEPQKIAVTHTDGPILIVAGAGAGKTKTITHRIINLIHKGVNPKEILAITFTNKAAKEMRDRVIKLISEERSGVKTGFPDYEGPCIKTFHSLGVQIIKEESKLVGVPRHFSIADESETNSLIKESLLELELDPKQFEPRRLKSLISRQKGDFKTAEDFSSEAEGYFPKILASVWLKYEKKLKDEGALDFDDLILKTVVLLKKNPEIRKKYQERFKYIHIDEYQDTNESQYELSKLLAGERKNICVVGDSDQNIYGWRGANIKNIINFEKDYPGTEVVLLEENYRSTKNILLAANQIIKKNTVRKEKNLFTNNRTGEKVGLFEAYDEADEANFVSKKISELKKSGIDYKEIAVLYRANFQSRIFEEYFFNEGIPYQVLGTKFFERKEVKDVLSYVRLSLNPEGLYDLKRVINVPARGIGKASLAKILAGKESELPLGIKEKLKKFREIVGRLKAISDKDLPSKIVSEAIKISGIENHLKEGTEEDRERLENAYELSALASRYDKMPIGEGLEKFLEDAALFSDQDDLDAKKVDGVKLMTVHSSKGLEFSHVFIVGLEQDLFPHQRMDSGKVEKEQEEEERRLFYVAITRAREKIFLSYAMMRTVFGSKQINTSSEFIFDMPHEIMEQEERVGSGEKIIRIEI